MEKDKKKTLTISSGLKKKIDTSSISAGGKKSLSVKKLQEYMEFFDKDTAGKAYDLTNILLKRLMLTQ